MNENLENNQNQTSTLATMTFTEGKISKKPINSLLLSKIQNCSILDWGLNISCVLVLGIVGYQSVKDSSPINIIKNPTKNKFNADIAMSVSIEKYDSFMRNYQSFLEQESLSFNNLEARRYQSLISDFTNDTKNLNCHNKPYSVCTASILQNRQKTLVKILNSKEKTFTVDLTKSQYMQILNADITAIIKADANNNIPNQHPQPNLASLQLETAANLITVKGMASAEYEAKKIRGENNEN